MEIAKRKVSNIKVDGFKIEKYIKTKKQINSIKFCNKEKIKRYIEKGRKMNESERKIIKINKRKCTVLKEKEKLLNCRKKARHINIKKSRVGRKIYRWKRYEQR